MKFIPLLFFLPLILTAIPMSNIIVSVPSGPLTLKSSRAQYSIKDTYLSLPYEKLIISFTYQGKMTPEEGKDFFLGFRSKILSELNRDSGVKRELRTDFISPEKLHLLVSFVGENGEKPKDGELECIFCEGKRMGLTLAGDFLVKYEEID